MIIIGYLLLHVPPMYLALGWVWVWSTGLIDIWGGNAGKETKPDPSTPAPSAFDLVVEWLMKFLWSAGACMAVIVGLGFCIVILASVLNILIPLANPAVMYVKRRLGWEEEGNLNEEDEEDEENEYHSSEWPKFMPPRLPSSLVHVACQAWDLLKNSEYSYTVRITNPYLMVLSHNPPVLLVLGYVIGHVVAFLLCLAWASIWLYGVVKLWEANLTESYGNIFMTMFVWSFSLLWSGGACAAMGIGFYASFTVIKSFVGPIFEGGRWQSVAGWEVESIFPSCGCGGWNNTCCV